MATESEGDMEFLWKWRKYLLLLATLVASVTYVAGLNPPGGIRSEDGGNDPEHGVGDVRLGAVNPPAPLSPAPAVYPFLVGDPVLVHTYADRYTAFFYCNAAAFVASLVIIMFLLDRRISGNRVGLTVLRSAMLLDLLALMAAFAAGSCRSVVGSIYVSALFALVFAYVAIHVRLERSKEPADESHLKERRKFLLLLATFATPLTYGAGLAPPGGFWSETRAGHRAGAPLLHDGPYKIRYHAFFYANANSFVASLAIIMLLMSSTLSGRLARSYALPVCVLVELLGLMAAYAAGSCRWITTTVYIACLVGAVFLYILLQVVIAGYVSGIHSVKYVIKEWKQSNNPNNEEKLGVVQEGGVTRRLESNNGQQGAEKVEESRSLLLLLATLAATVTYQAGLSPPGGVWPEGHLDSSHTAGNPVLHDINPKRYKAFYHCNTAAFVASLVVIVIVQSKELSSGAVVRRAALNTVMILDLFGLMGAYVAGSCRDGTTTIYVASLAVAIFVYSIAKVVAFSAKGKHSKLTRWVQSMCESKHILQDEKRILERKRKFLLQLAILAATVTYQTGLNPPGGFWTKSDGGISVTAGDPVLLDYYGVRYQVFFYCNATGFMASVAVILLLVNQTLSKQGIRSHALHVCILVGLLGLMGAYAAGSCRKLRTSIYVFALVAVVVAFLLVQILLYVFADRDHWLDRLPRRVKVLFKPLWTGPTGCSKDKSKEDKPESERYLKRKYLMVLGILAASVTYQAGLAPPGGTWGDDDTAPSPSPSQSAYPPTVAGNPILLDFNAPRYQAFFYCNATSFVASIVVIMLLLQRTLKPRGPPLWAMQTAVLLDLLGLLGAYAAGSCRDWETSIYVITLVAIVVLFIALHVLLSFHVVFIKAKKLMPNKCFEVDDN
uniref:PGG domain-containing protein n=1 Tax=Aegilops tauschii subsp. strangulata TaxID=200361 RepID=A0A453JCN0_AEGTS